MLKKKDSGKVSMLNIEEEVLEYSNLRNQSKQLKSRMDTIAKDIKEFVSKFGVKDEKGSSYCENDSFIYGQCCKKSVSFKKEETIEFLKQRGFSSAVKIEETIDEDAVESLINEGKISYEDIEDLTDIKTSYAIDIKEKKDLPEIEQHEVAARRRKQ